MIKLQLTSNISNYIYGMQDNDVSKIFLKRFSSHNLRVLASLKSEFSARNISMLFKNNLTQSQFDN